MVSNGRPNAEDIFKGRSSDYSQYRPSYPPDIIPLLEKEIGFSPASVVADVGAGTGILSRLFIENGNTVFGVEPNDEMRGVAKTGLRAFPNFHALKGTGEETNLQQDSIDLVVCGQSFHWLDPVRAKVEFRRILKEPGNVALFWNDRVDVQGGFNPEYEKIIMEYSPKYHSSGSTVLDDGLFEDFFSGTCRVFTLDNFQELNLEGIMGRYQSASYSISQDDKNYQKLVNSFEEAFKEHQENGFVKLLYKTKAFIGTLPP